MQSIADVIGGMDNGRMESTEDFCIKHEVKAVGQVYIKKIKKVVFDGIAFCPLCESEKATKELEDKIKKAYDDEQERKKYNIFNKQNVITDVDLLEASFGNYKTTEQEEVTNKERASKAFVQYRDGKVFNTWFTGAPGVGKSHLAMSVLRNLNEAGEQNRSCLFVSVDSMLMRIRESFSDKESRYTEAYFIDLLSNVDFLVLDDLGAETGSTGTDKKATDFTMRVLYAIANGRRDKSTLVTTNLSKQELIKMYDPKLVSRLMGEMYKISFEQTTDKRIRELEF